MKNFLYYALAMTMLTLPAFGERPESDKDKKPRLNAEEIKGLQTLSLKVEQKEGKMVFSWSPATSKASEGVKIVSSYKNDQPLYPYDNAIAWIPGNGHSSYSIDARKARHKGRFFRVCSVMPGDHKKFVALSNVVEIDLLPEDQPMTILEKHRMQEKDKEYDKPKKPADKDKKPADMSYCTKCGAKTAADHNFCGKCGTKLK